MTDYRLTRGELAVTEQVHDATWLGEVVFMDGLDEHLGRRGSMPGQQLVTLPRHDDAAGKAPSLEGLYWPTPVLGSGCLVPDEKVLDELGHRVEATAAVLDELEEDGRVPRLLEDGGRPAVRVETFLRAMIRDRVGAEVPRGGDRPAEEAPASASQVHSLLARWTLLAALLTEVQQLAQAALVTPIWGDRDDTVELTGLPAIDQADWSELYIEPARSLVRSIEAEVTPDRVLPRRLLKTLKDELAAGTLTARHLQRLTEYVWMTFSEGVDGLFPGWRDVMYRLSLESGRGFLPVGRREDARPTVVDRVAMSAQVRGYLAPPTERHWKDSSALHDAVAALLHELIAFRTDRSKIKQGTKGDVLAADWPPAVAYTFSFDVEVDKALWRSGRPFLALLPVVACYSIDVGDDDETGTPQAKHVVPFWLGRLGVPSEVAPGAESSESMLGSRLEDPAWVVVSEISSLDVSGRIAPGVDRSFTFHGSPRSTGEADGSTGGTSGRLVMEELPIVVHAVGAPLYELPPDMEIGDGLVSDVTDDGSRVWEELHRQVIRDLGGKSGSVSWCHDLLLDDFAAAQRNSVELASEMSSNPYPPVLPSGLVEATALNEGIRRCWVAAGLPLSEACVRQRFASLARRGQEGSISSFGLLVNRTIGIQESDLLAWLDFEFCPSSVEHLATGFEQIAGYFGERAGGLA